MMKQQNLGPQMLSSSPPSPSSSPPTSLLASLNSKEGGLFRFTKKWSRFNLIFAIVFAAYAIFIAHLLRTKPLLALINLRQFPPPPPPPPPTSTVVAQASPPPLPLPPPFSVIKEECKSHRHPDACFEALALIPSTKYARSSMEVVVMAIDAIYNETVLVRSKLVDMLRSARENRKDYSKLQCGMLRQCVEMSDYLMDFMEEDANEGLPPGTLGAYLNNLDLHLLTCVGEFDDESDFLQFDNGTGSYKPLKDVVYSLWDRIDGLDRSVSHIVRSKGMRLLQIEELNPTPLMVVLTRARNVVLAEASPPRGLLNYVVWWIRRAFPSSS